MKVLHIDYSDGNGGAHRATYRVHYGLLKTGEDSKMLVQRKFTNRKGIITPFSNAGLKAYVKIRKHVGRAFQRLQNTNNSSLHSSNILPSGLHRKINKSDADIVHLHWINAEMISIREIAKITKPIVWTLQDMWAFCGAEHYDSLHSPGRYREGYTAGNRPEGHTGLDIDRLIWKRKKRYWTENRQTFNFVTPTSWMAECLHKSALFPGKEAEVIPNGLNTTVFKPTEKKQAREMLNLPTNKKIILYGAVKSTKNRYKGYKELLEAKDYLTQKNDASDLLFVVFGNSHPSIRQDKNGVKTQFLGTIRSNKKLALIYSSADVMVVPSLMEAFGQTGSESLACGTPVVAFNNSGLKDIVDHKTNGYLAKSFDTEDLASGIQWVLEYPVKDELSKQSRKKVVNTFDINRVADQYVELYHKLI